MADAAKGSMESLSSWWKVAALGTMAAQNSGGRCPKPVVRTPTHRWREPDSNRQYRPSVPCDTTHFSRGLMSALLDSPLAEKMTRTIADAHHDTAGLPRDG